MPACPVCSAYQPRTLVQPFRCDGCGTELKIAGSTILACVLMVVPLVAGLILAMPWIGRGGVIAIGIVGGNVLPWIGLYLFYRLDATGTALDLEHGPRRRGRL